MARIMTVDDSRLVRSIITASLGEAGYETVEAENGKEAMELLAENPVDLILLDVMMPSWMVPPCWPHCERLKTTYQSFF